MKMAIISIITLIAGFAHAGAVSGDKILFQKHSTYVSAVYSNTLCLDGDMYRAVITKCTKRSSSDDGDCLATKKVSATQPMYSTRKVCAVTGGNDENYCRRFTTVEFYQSPVRTVKFYSGSDDRHLVRTEVITIPKCN